MNENYQALLREPLMLGGGDEESKVSQLKRSQSQSQAQIIFKAKQFLLKRAKELDGEVVLDPEEETNRKQLTSQLQKMGIDQEIAIYCLSSVRWQGLEMALAFRFEEDDFGQLVHDYVPGQFSCFICEKLESEHADHPDKMPEDDFFDDEELLGNQDQRPGRKSMVQIADKLKRQISDVALKITAEVPATEGPACEMCYEALYQNTDQNFEFLCGQNHIYHIECVKESFQDFIKRGEINKLVCLGGCKYLTSADEIAKIFVGEQDVITRYVMLTEKKNLESDPLMRYCPQAKCEGIIKAPNKQAKQLECPLCQESICFQCKEPWHEDTSCYENEKRLMKELGGGDFGSCPVCRVKVERTKGCNKMACTYCGNNWCWECGESIEGYAHFNGKNGCGAGVFGGRDEGARRARRCCIIPVGILVAFLCLPFISLCPLYCVIAICIGDYLKQNPQAQANMCTIMFIASCGAWGYIYYIMYEQSLYWLFLNFGIFCSFMCCVGLMWCCQQAFVQNQTPEQLDQQARNVREEAERRRDAIVNGEEPAALQKENMQNNINNMLNEM